MGDAEAQFPRAHHHYLRRVNFEVICDLFFQFEIRVLVKNVTVTKNNVPINHGTGRMFSDVNLETRSLFFYRLLTHRWPVIVAIRETGFPMLFGPSCHRVPNLG